MRNGFAFRVFLPPLLACLTCLAELTETFRSCLLHGSTGNLGPLMISLTLRAAALNRNGTERGAEGDRAPEDHINIRILIWYMVYMVYITI